MKILIDIPEEIYNSVHDTVVTAWMPLPETYKAESEVSDENSD